jgi:hypothetical protein
MAPRTKLIAIHPVHGYVITPQQDLKTIKRNARERNRVQAVNSCFENLRRNVPSAAVYKKMSKVNIVHNALEYIHQLMQVLEGEQISPVSSDYSSACSPVPSYPSPSCSVQDLNNRSYSVCSPSPQSSEWDLKSQASQCIFAGSFVIPGEPHHPHHFEPMISPDYSQYSPPTFKAADFSPMFASSALDSCCGGLGQFSTANHVLEEEADVLDAIVDWQSS